MSEATQKLNWKPACRAPLPPGPHTSAVAVARAAEAFALAEAQQYERAAAVLGELVLSGQVTHAGPMRMDLMADVVHAQLKHRAGQLYTVVVYAFFISATSPHESVAELSSLLAKTATELTNIQTSALLRFRGWLLALHGRAASSDTDAPADAQAGAEAALVDFERAWKLDGTNMQALYLKSKVLRSLQRPAEALSTLQLYLEMVPSDEPQLAQAYYELMVLLCKVQRSDTSLSSQLQAILLRAQVSRSQLFFSSSTAVEAEKVERSEGGTEKEWRSK